jgi:hypothetical protein
VDKVPKRKQARKFFSVRSPQEDDEMHVRKIKDYLRHIEKEGEAQEECNRAMKESKVRRNIAGVSKRARHQARDTELGGRAKSAQAEKAGVESTRRG